MTDTKKGLVRRVYDKIEEAAGLIGQKTAIAKAMVFGAESEYGAGAQSGQMAEDRLVLRFDGSVLEPYYDPVQMYQVYENSSALRPVIDAFITGTECYGERPAPRVRIDKIKDQAKKDQVQDEIRRERERIENWWALVCSRQSLMKLRSRKRRDTEVTGNGFWEIVRDLGGHVAEINWLPAIQTRLGPEDDEFTEYRQNIVVQRDGMPEIYQKVSYRRFRTFCMGYYGYRTRAGQESMAPGFRWFKEYGDPRVHDAETGFVVPDEKVEDWDGLGHPMPRSRRATEVLWWSLDPILGPYGVPRWVGIAMGQLGLRGAEVINYNTLTNPQIPAMLLAVSNGRLTAGSIERIKGMAEAIKKGKHMGQILIVEGESGFGDEPEESQRTKIDAKPLTAVQHKDAMFLNYSEQGHNQAHQVFRTPSLMTGRVKDYTKASADAARQVVDEQAWSPERSETDWVLTRLLVDAGFRWHRYLTRTPNVTDNEKIVRMMAISERVGAMTPRLARAIMEDLFPQTEEVGPPDYDVINPDVPMSWQLAQASKRQSDPAEPNNFTTPTQPAADPPESSRGSYDVDNPDTSLKP